MYPSSGGFGGGGFSHPGQQPQGEGILYIPLQNN